MRIAGRITMSDVPNLTGRNLFEGKCVNRKKDKALDSALKNGKTENVMKTQEPLKLELNKENVPGSIKNIENIRIDDVPRNYTIAIETLESRINHVKSSLKKADSMNLSYGERMKFLKEDGKRWVKNVKKNDPEMFVQWLKFNKDRIMNGRSDLASLPNDFSMEDYYKYVKDEGFSILA